MSSYGTWKKACYLIVPLIFDLLKEKEADHHAPTSNTQFFSHLECMVTAKTTQCKTAKTTWLDHYPVF